MIVRLFLTLALIVTTNQVTAVDRDYALEQAAIRQATEAIADSVVQIRTVGGFERVGETTMSAGPATGLVITPDGYIVSSAFNFAQRPSSILVGLPNGKQVPAELVARDLNRMLVLLKVESDESFSVPTFVPEREIAVGQWSLAVGRTFQTDHVDTSLGIISALNRMHGRAVQTDANVSGANYGGPLIDIRGRVFGILVPMSPQSAEAGAENEVAGAEFYDSGIGFAIPLEHILSELDRWKGGEDLLPGKLGIGMKAGSPFIEPPAIVSVWPGSPAAAAGWKSGDTIIAVDGKMVETQSQLQFLTKPRYAGDLLTISIRRGASDKAEEFDSEIRLAAKLPAYRQAFLGIIPAPATDKEESGVVVEHVWPESPAAKAGVRPVDRLTKLGETKIDNLKMALVAMKAVHPESQLSFGVSRGEEETSLTATLTTMPEEILSATDLEIEKVESKDPREAESLKLPQFTQEAKYIAANPKRDAPGLLIWLAENPEKEEEQILKAWQSICDRDNLVLVLPRSASEEGWQFDDLEYLDNLARFATARFSADSQRIVIAGSGKAGQLASTLGLRRADAFSGFVSDNAPLPRTLKVPDNGPENQLAALVILPKNSAFAPLVKQDVTSMREAGFPVSVLDRDASDESLPDGRVIGAISRWIDGLRRF